MVRAQWRFRRWMPSTPTSLGAGRTGKESSVVALSMNDRSRRGPPGSNETDTIRSTASRRLLARLLGLVERQLFAERPGDTRSFLQARDVDLDCRKALERHRRPHAPVPPRDQIGGGDNET